MIRVRPETTGDEEGIFAVEQAAFADHPHSEGTEPFIVDRLREDGDLVASLVLEDDDEIIGHVAFSPAILSDSSEGWWTLGPIGIAPARQGEGLGRILVEESSAFARQQGAQGIVLLGDPALYTRFGFTRETPMQLDGPLAEYLHVLSFGADIPAASVSFAPAFKEARVSPA